jgi:hypothetical protein
MEPGPLRSHQGGGPARGAGLRQRGHQEGAVPRGGQRSRLAGEGAAVVGARLSLPRPPALPGDSPECKPQPPAPGGDGCGKDLNYWFSRERRAERGTERVPKEVQRHAKLVVLDTIGVILVGASRPDAPPQCALDRKKP